MQIGFLPVTIWDVLDVLIVGYLMYRIYKLLRGSIGFNIFVGVITVLAVYWSVDWLNMNLLSALFKQFVSIGVLIIVIIFQPEMRRFLLLLGDSTLKQRSNFWSRILSREATEDFSQKQQYVQAIKSAILHLSEKKTGALIILANDLNLEFISDSGILIQAQIRQQLLESIFNKESPLHDGAVIISNNKIYAAGCVLPVSDNHQLPSNVGLRHRAAVGITEKANVSAFIVSEETGTISYAFNGQLRRRLSEKKLLESLNKYYN